MSSRILPIIVGTAGHVDHGKTSLVYNLTNFNTDRHPEERKRGMSIDFAVAPYTTSDGLTVGIVDVPGHEDFIRNAISGVSSIDILLLVVAADDGIMPQTLEHLLISKYLGTKTIIPIITKIDTVDYEQLNKISKDITSLLKEHNVPHAEPSLITNIQSNKDFQNNFTILKDKLDSTIKSTPVSNNSSKAFRMHIRACFSSSGLGTVITGVPISGTLKKEDKLELFSILKDRTTLLTVKNIENYRNKTDLTSCHISSALNLRDGNSQDLTRGSVVATPDIFKATSTLLVVLTGEHNIKKGKTYLLHSGTLAIEAIATPIQWDNTINELVQLRLTHQTVLCSGDKFIIRDNNKTIAGGVVISSTCKLPRRSFRELLARQSLKAFKQITSENGELTSELLTTAPLILETKDIIRLSQASFDLSSIEKLKLTKIGKNLYLNLYREEYFSKATHSILKRYHREKPTATGLQILQFINLLSAKKFEAAQIETKSIIQILTKEPKLIINNDLISLEQTAPNLNQEQVLLINKIVEVINEHLYISKQTLIDSLRKNNKTISPLFKILEAEKKIRSIDTHIFKYEFIDSIKTKLSDSFKDREFELNEFRELSGLSRNLAVLILEHFDSTAFTKRANNKRKLS